MIHTRRREAPVVVRNKVPSSREGDGEQYRSTTSQTSRSFCQELLCVQDMLKRLRTDDEIYRSVLNRPDLSCEVASIRCFVSEVWFRGLRIYRGIGRIRMDQRSIRLGTRSDVQDSSANIR